MDNLISSLWASMMNALNNQLVGGGLVLMIVGSLGALGRRIPHRLWVLTQRQFIVSFEVMNNDPTYHWLMAWLDKQPFSKRVRDVTVSVRKNVWGDTLHEAGTDGPKVLMTPAPGTHWFIYKGRFILLTRSRQESKDSRATAYTPPPETITLRILGRSQSVLTELIEDARRTSIEATGSRVSVHISSAHGGWRKIQHYTPRSLDSVILPAGMKEKLLATIETFLASREWYGERGVPWRKHFMFHGTPGSGKTSLIAALAGHLNFDLFILNLTSPGMNDENLSSLMLDVPPRAAVIIEEITDVVKGREVKNSTGGDFNSSAVTYSGFINALDGIASKEGVLVFMTTNSVLELDESMLRPGRGGVPVRFGTATRDQIERMFEFFYRGDYDRAMASRFAETVVGKNLSMAAVQQHFLNYPDDPEQAFERADECGESILSGRKEIAA